MKTILLLLLVCCCVESTLAQTPNGADSLRTELDRVFIHLDKSQVPTGYLAEYAVPLLPLNVFDGTLSDSNRTNTDVWRQAFATLATSRIYGTGTLPRLDSLAARTDRASSASSAIPIALQRINYAALRPDAVSAGLLTVQNQQLYDVPGRSQSPYVVRTLFVAGPASTYSRSGNVTFVFPQALHVQSGGGTLRGLELDFGNGQGYRSAAWDQPLSVAYGAAGTYRIKVRVQYNISTIASDGTNSSTTEAAIPPTQQYVTYESHFDLVVAQAAGAAARYADAVTPVNFPRDPFPGSTSGGTVYIRYGGNHTQLTNAVNRG